MIRQLLIPAALLTLISACHTQWHDPQEAVRNQMKDPAATQFRNMKRCGEEGLASDVVISGEYNGKNSYGAYEGFKTFYWAGGLPEFDYDTSTPLFKKCMAEMERHTAKMRADVQARSKPSR